jgi:hypothetical protein
VVAVRSYRNLIQAALAKSLLDNYGIFCALAHENAHLYGGGPWAMPIQLMVDENQAESAQRILNGDIEGAAEMEAAASGAGPEPETETRPEMVANNPWELLVVAAFLLLPGVTVLTIKYQAVMTSSQRARTGIAAVSVMHFLGWLAVAFAGCLIVAYVYLRRLSRTTNAA